MPALELLFVAIELEDVFLAKPGDHGVADGVIDLDVLVAMDAVHGVVNVILEKVQPESAKKPTQTANINAKRFMRKAPDSALQGWPRAVPGLQLEYPARAFMQACVFPTVSTQRANVAIVLPFLLERPGEYMKRIWISLFGAVLALGLGGCAGGDEGGDTVVSGARTPPGLPSLQAVRWQTDGGSALGQAGFSGGDAGNIAVTTNAGAVLRYGKQTLPTPAKNLLATATTITYADLVALLTPRSAPRLLLSRCLRTPASTYRPTPRWTSVTPALVWWTTLKLKAFNPFASMARSSRRAPAASVSLALNFNGATELGLAVTGSINTSGAPTRDGGDLTLFSLASVVLTGTVDCSGGAASAAMMINGRPGGELQVFAQFGDVLLWRARSRGGGGGTARAATEAVVLSKARATARPIFTSRY